MSDPKPSTADGSPLAAFTPVDPHGQSHNADGSDPTIDSIRYLGTSPNVGGSTSSLTYTSLYDLPVTSRGGQLLVLFTADVGVFDLSDTTAFGRIRCSIDGNASTAYGIAMQATGATAVALTPGSTFTWVISALAPGNHTVTVEYKVESDTSDTLAVNSGVFVVFELLPFRSA